MSGMARRIGPDLIGDKAAATRVDQAADGVRSPARLSTIALLGNFLPRLCGIATFTTHVHDAMRRRFPDLSLPVYAMVDPGDHYDFPDAVVETIGQEAPRDYERAARSMAARNIDLIWVQHEFGIFGGPAGILLLELLDAVAAPIVVTLHTVLDRPNDEQRKVMEGLIDRASLLIVMADRARGILTSTYGAPPDKIAVIPHGVPDRPYVAPAAARRAIGLPDRKTILTFGLLSPGKGIETMIRAMPAILARSPDAIYRIAGATHPHLVAREGEAYRNGLKALAAQLGVSSHIVWDERFLAEDELLDLIAAADIYVTPYLNEAQITSGTLAYAAGLGKPIVSTPYIHAQELLADRRGVLVDLGSPAAFGEAVGGLLADDCRRVRMARDIHAYSRAMTWDHLAARAFERFRDLMPCHRARRADPASRMR